MSYEEIVRHLLYSKNILPKIFRSIMSVILIICAIFIFILVFVYAIFLETFRGLKKIWNVLNQKFTV